MTWDMSRRDGPFCEGCEAVHKAGRACPGCGTKTCRRCGWCCECADRTAVPVEAAAPAADALQAAADAVASQEERGVIVVAPGAFTVSTGDWDA